MNHELWNNYHMLSFATLQDDACLAIQATKLSTVKYARKISKHFAVCQDINNIFFESVMNCIFAYLFGNTSAASWKDSRKLKRKHSSVFNSVLQPSFFIFKTAIHFYETTQHAASSVIGIV